MKSVHRRTLILTVAVLGLHAVGCTAPNPRESCVHGQSVACSCTDGRRGAQVCTAELVFGPCQCRDDPASDAARPADAGASAADAGGPELPRGWRPLSGAGQPTPRLLPAGAWTGSELLVWGGTASDGTLLVSGGRYRRGTDSWRPMSTAGAPSGRAYFASVWTGQELLVWGGQDFANYVWRADGGRYDPQTDTWRALPAVGLAGREAHTAVWSGQEMIVWGGYNHLSKTWFQDGARYDPATDQWRPVSKVGAPAARNQHTAVWIGARMLVWGGNNGATVHRDGGLYDPATDTWQLLTAPTNVAARRGHAAAWTGAQLIVWGGYGAVKGNQPAYFLADGAVFTPATGEWRATAASILEPRMRPAAVWSGTQLFFWGGNNVAENAYLMGGGVYTPGQDSWSPMPDLPAEAAVVGPAAVWTGQELLLWGGVGDVAGLAYVP